MKYFSAVVMTLLLAFALIQPTDAKDDGFREKMTARMSKELNLTADQKAAVEKIQEKYRSGNEETREKWKAAKKDLHESMKATTKGAEYQSELLKKFETAENLKAEMNKNRFQMALEIRELLSDDQIQKFKGLDHHGKKFGKKHKRGH